MATIGSVTRQIAALEISNKQNKPTTSTSSRAGHSKQASQEKVTKLLTKFSAPNPFSNSKPAQGSSLRHPTNAPNQHAASSSASSSKSNLAKSAVQPPLDIGTYDGGLETENEKRGEKVYGEAAEELALDSSVSGYVASCWLWACRPASVVLNYAQQKPNQRMDITRLRHWSTIRQGQVRSSLHGPHKVGAQIHSRFEDALQVRDRPVQGGKANSS